MEKTQQERLKEYLEKADGRVSAKDIVNDLWLFQYNARIYELRHEDWLDIINQIKHHNTKDGYNYKMWYFKLIKAWEDPEEEIDKFLESNQ